MNFPLDTVLRGAGLALGLALFLALAMRGGWRAHRPMLGVLACACAYLVCSAPSDPCCTSGGTLPLLVGAIAFPFAFWHLARVALADDRWVPPLAWAGAAVLLAGGIAAVFEPIELPAAVRMAGAAANKVAAFAFIGAALYDAWRTWDGDLVEGRRKLRWALLAYLGGYGLVILVAEMYLLGARPPAWLDLLNVVMIDASLLAALVLLLQPHPAMAEALLAPAAAPAAPPQPTAVQAVDTDELLLARLRELMETQKLYRDAELSVGTLANRAAVPEYVLRRLIHQRLGHRNFASYVNEHRLEEVAQRLRDPALARRPVLTLALEAGFGSIGPFNRAFKERYGVTPTEFRTQERTGLEAVAEA